ncbi:Ferredoxin--NADP reductase [Achromobacter anxifer]|nr:Ferredoxin--NADP reductase [Achromobacter anxifer]
MEDCSVAILGGGDSAFQSYLALKQAGAPRITIFARSLRARAQLVTAVPETDVRLGEYDVNPIHNEVNGQPYNLVHVCYGYEVPRRSLMGLMVGLSPEGLVLTDNHYETAVPGVFAIGDMAGKMRPSSAAAFAEGLIVAREIQRRLDAPVLQSLSERLTRSPGRVAALDNH